MASIRKRGTAWQVQVRRAGLPPCTRTFRLKADAEHWGRLVEAEIDRGDLPDGRQALRGKSLADLFRLYRDKVTPTKRGALQERYRLEQFLVHNISAVPLERLTPAIFARYRDKRINEGGPLTVRRELALIRHVIEVARKEWGIPLRDNPLGQISYPPVSKPRHRRLSKGEYDQIVMACKSVRTQWLRQVFLIAIETGMRRGELVSIRWTDLDLDQRTLHLPMTKNGHPRTIPLSTKAVEIIRSVPKTDERVFPITANALRLAWERLRRRAGITDLHFHDLRHEAISRFFEKGLSVPEVALISGHRDYRMLFRYTHLRAEDIVGKLE